MESQDQIVQEKYDQTISLEKATLVKSITQEYQRCCCIYYNTFSEENKMKPLDPKSDEQCVDHWLEMDFEAPEDME
ncbi:unnamed protein product [Moneuplotes crassus]|uniref:Uncharacterized protein n=1 Tax=Euplotes crassus TaxID=5936 RepID=A0AAD1X3V5_EUPCR|nr:unnamed protein product [Moneuplotes crassus]